VAEFDFSEFRARLRSPTVAGVRIGVGVGDVERRHLSLADVNRIVAREIAERDEAASEYERLGRGEQADALRKEISILERFKAP
jgi:uncharacterized protein